MPYGALALPAGRHELDLEAGIYTHSGDLIVSAAVPETVQSAAVDDDVGVVPAPQSLGVWPFDPATGHEIVIKGSHVRFEGDPGWEERVLESRVDLTLVGLAGERLELETRLRQSDGTVVGIFDRPAGGTLEPCLARVALLPQQIVSKIPAVRVMIPVADLDLPCGEHRLFVETVVVSGDGKVVCGAFEPVTIEIVSRGAAERGHAEPAESSVASDAELDVGAIVIAPASRNDRVMLDVGVTASTRDWESSHYRLLVALESRDGTPIRNIGAADRPVLRSVWFGGERRPPGEARVVRVSFDAREFARSLKIKGSTERDIVTRIRVMNEAGRTVFETTRIVASDFAADVRAAMPLDRSNVPVRPVDVTFEGGYGAGAGQKLLLTLDVNRFAQQSDRCTVYYEFVDDNGEPQRRSERTGELCGDVAAVTFPFVERVGQRRWYQTAIEIPCPIVLARGAAPAGINLTIFSCRGEFWGSGHYSLSTERCGEPKTPVSRVMSCGRDDGVDSAGRSVASAGLLSKIRSALIG